MKSRSLACGLFFAWCLSGCATGAVPLPLASSAAPDASKHNAEGVEHYKMGHYDVAKEHFDAATKSDPKSAEAYFNMALVLDKLGDHQKATGYFKRAAELDPNNQAITQSSEYQVHVNPPKDAPGMYGTPGAYQPRKAGAPMGY